MIEILNLSKIFQTGDQVIRAVDDLSFTVPEGQFLMITGRSGSGKSTLLYQLGLLDEPTTGHIHIDDIDVDQLDDEERTRMRLHYLGYVFQDYAVLPTLSALENVMVPLLMAGEAKEVAREKAERALMRLSLGDRMHNLPSQLSGGQQQRVAIARAIAHSPRILFADEPTANLDSETSENVVAAFLDLSESGQTIIMVTHEPEYAKMGHRTLTLADGKIVSDIMNEK